MAGILAPPSTGVTSGTGGGGTGRARAGTQAGQMAGDSSSSVPARKRENRSGSTPPRRVHRTALHHPRSQLSSSPFGLVPRQGATTVPEGPAVHSSHGRGTEQARSPAMPPFGTSPTGQQGGRRKISDQGSIGSGRGSGRSRSGPAIGRSSSVPPSERRHGDVPGS